MRKFIVIIGIMALSLLSGCSRQVTMQNVHNQPHFYGTVTEVFSDAILVSGSDGLFSVSLDVYLADSITTFMSGDEVVVYHDGGIMYSHPAQLNRVYAILLTSPSKMDVWADTVMIDAFYSFAPASSNIRDHLDNPSQQWQLTERQQINDLYDWFVNLSLARAASQQTPSGMLLSDGYFFTLHLSNHFSWDGQDGFTVHSNDGEFSFSYGKANSGEWYLHFNDVWYRVLNPSDPFGFGQLEEQTAPILPSEQSREWTIEELGETIAAAGTFWDDWRDSRGAFAVEHIADATWDELPGNISASTTWVRLLPASGFESMGDIRSHLLQYYTETWVDLELFREQPVFIEYNGILYASTVRAGFPRPNWETATHTLVEQDGNRAAVETTVLWVLGSWHREPYNQEAYPRQTLYRFTLIDGKIDSYEATTTSIT